MLSGIEILLKVIECGSFSKAASALNLATSSVTRQVSTLEKELGTVLLKRSTRSLMLTEHGEQFIDEANELLEQAYRLKHRFKEESSNIKGNLHLSVFESFGRVLLAPKLKHFLHRYPDINVDLSLDNHVIDLNKHNIDIAIRIGKPQDSCLKARKLLNNETILVASTDYLHKNGSPQKPEDLVHHSCLKIGKLKQRNYWYFRKKTNKAKTIHSDQEQKKIAINGRLSSLGGTAVIQAAKDGLGLAQCSKWLIQEELASGQLQTCLGEWRCSMTEGETSEIFALYRSATSKSVLINAFMAFLAEQFPLNDA
ncbi:LysR family transcriptional regulator [Agaribacterium sp. ZY112]|uniref:LysR family transcriptional regulator n=1 Tax=Agaribacterium sp. ZY112 TaxID=3233574 RepID=UPI0035251175